MLADIATRIAARAGNVIDVTHRRLFAAPSVQAAELEVMVEARDAGHAGRSRWRWRRAIRCGGLECWRLTGLAPSYSAEYLNQHYAFLDGIHMMQRKFRLWEASMRRSLLAVTCIAVLASGMAGHAHAAPYTFSTITVPGVNDAQALGINNRGQIIIEGGDFVGDVYKGFLDTGGNVVPVDLSGGNLFLTALNNNGQITGNAFLTAFIDTNGVFAFLPSPGPAQLGLPASLGFPNGFFATGINNSDVVTGFNVLVSGTVRGTIDTPENFTYANGKFTLLPFQPAGINDAGQIVGSGGVLSTDGVFTPVNVPGPVKSTQTAAINNSGVIAGTYSDASGSHGFVDNNGVFAMIDVPGAYSGSTFVTGINDAGDVVGYYIDNTAALQEHPFLATPTSVAVPEPASTALLATGLAGLALALRQRRRGA